MAKIEKIGNIQIVDNKEDKFFYFPMISMACTGKPVYSIGRPAFDKAVINLPEEKTFSIVVKNNGKKNKYIESVSLNGKALNIPFFNHQDIANGGTMEIKMTDHPTKWGVLSPALSSKKEE